MSMNSLFKTHDLKVNTNVTFMLRVFSAVIRVKSWTLIEALNEKIGGL